MNHFWDFLKEHQHAVIAAAVFIVAMVSWRHRKRWPSKEEFLELMKCAASSLTAVTLLVILLLSRNSDLWGAGVPLTLAAIWMSYESLSKLAVALEPLRTKDDVVEPVKPTDVEPAKPTEEAAKAVVEPSKSTTAESAKARVELPKRVQIAEQSTLEPETDEEVAAEEPAKNQARLEPPREN